MTVEKCNEKGYHTGRFTDETETENKRPRPVLPCGRKLICRKR